MRSSLSRTLNFRLTLAILLAGFLTGASYYVYVGNEAESELTHYTTTLIENFSSNLALPLWDFDDISLEQISNTLLESRGVVGIKILNEKNQSVFEAGAYSEPDILNISREVYYQKEYVGHVEIFFSTVHTRETKRNTFITAVLIIIAIVLLFVPLMNLAIRGLVILPLQDLVDLTGRVGSGELDVSVSTEFENEVGQLFRSFNQMTQRLREAAIKKEAAEEQLRASNAELEEFAYRTSHDLRSPLVSSIGLLNMTKKALDSGKQDRAFQTVEQTQKSLKKLEALVKDILMLTQTKNTEEENQTINIGSIVTETLEKFCSMENFERLSVQQNLGFEGDLITKKSRFTLILENLVSNAIKYQDISKDNSFIKISTYAIKNNFVLEVSDNGLGIPEDQQANLFQMFKRFHPKVSFGSGLGLYMMKKSVDIIGGSISFEDTGEGSIFRLSIPL